MSPKKVVIHLMLILLQQISLGRSTLFRKAFDANDPDYPNLFKPLTNPPPKTLGSIIECSAYALYALNNANKKLVASAFQYIKGTGNCTLGRTPTYDDVVVSKPTIIDGRDGVNAVVGRKPLSTVNSDLFAYILLNEEKLFESSPGVPNPNFYGGSKYFTFTMPSPVQTLEGQFAATPVNSAYLLYTVSPHTYSAITCLLWYNNALSPTARYEPLLTLGDTTGTNGHKYVDFYTGYNGVKDLAIGLNDNVWQSTAPNLWPDSNWVYVGVTLDGIAGTINFYVNGTLVTPSFNSPSYQMQAAMDNIQIGSAWSPAAGATSLQNYLASVEVYQRTLSATEVAAAMAKSTTTRVRV